MEIQNQTVRPIPYGIMNFYNLRDEDYYFIDKTRFIPQLETIGKFLFIIRPRRMGKSLWLSMMECYYDLALKDEFEFLFRDTWIQKNPTKEKNSFLVLRLNFSDVNPAPDKVEKDFDITGKIALSSFLEKYENELGEETILKVNEETDFTNRLSVLFREVIKIGLKLHLFIDEYDNFSNTILSTSGTKEYHQLTRGEGFFRHFFNLLKGGAMQTGKGQIKLFITGVSPVTMDDVTSGFNIGTNISLEPSLNEMFGFTEQEVTTMLLYYSDNKRFPLDVEESLELMKEWYNGYVFSKKSETRLFNTDMVLYFINRTIISQDIPEYLIDQNVRIDYGKLRHLITVDNKLNGNFSALRKILEKGKTKANVVDSFPLEKLAEPNNFHSLLYYFGLLTFTEERGGRTTLKIPNQTVYQLFFSYIREALDETGNFRINFHQLSELVGDMAFDGEWEPLFNFLAEQIKEQTTIRDFLNEEKPIQSILSVYLNVTDYFLCYTEAELNKGYADFLLEPLWNKYPGIQHGALIEIKYMKRIRYTKEKYEKNLQKKIKEAKEQIASYEQDPKLREKIHNDKILKLILVFKGWELVHKERV